MALFSVIYPVSDIAASKAIFTTLLGTEPHTDMPYYVGYNVNGLEIALNPSGHSQGLKGAAPYWATSDITKAVEGLKAAGATVTQEPTDVGGKLAANLEDADGNAICLIEG